MQHCSQTIGNIAAALAKAQCELTNPQKSLTATVVSPFPREAPRSFRYASLACGLDIVRKCLGQYEIAAVQTTAIDETAGLIRLTTTLAHSSGEWISSDLPVCSVSESNSPHRLGAALTYARRYSLFTLVGIAGEDDLDAPDLPAVNHEQSSDDHGEQRGLSGEQVPGHLPSAGSPKSQASRNNGKPVRQPSIRLTNEDSGALRDRLICELEALISSDDLADWAHRILPSKNQMTTADARELECAFVLKVGNGVDATAPRKAANSLVDQHTAEAREGGIHSADVPSNLPRVNEANQGPTTADDVALKTSSTVNAKDPVIFRPVVVLNKTLRRRNREHLKFVGDQPCLACGRQPSDAHHVKFAQQSAMGRKVSDEYAVPLCRQHHRELHLRGDERVWWRQVKIDPLPVADRLWRQTQLKTPTRETKSGSDAGE